MRIAVRNTDEDHPNGEWFAFSTGRILGFTDPIHNVNYTPEQVADALLLQARVQFPEQDGYEHQVQTLHVSGVDGDGNETGAWYPIGESDLPRAGQGGVSEHPLEADQGQKAKAE